MFLTTKKEMCLLVWLTWDGFMDIPMWYMGLSAMELPLSCLKALQGGKKLCVCTCNCIAHQWQIWEGRGGRVVTLPYLL